MKTVVIAASLILTAAIGAVAGCGGDDTGTTATSGSTDTTGGDDNPCRPENQASCTVAQQVKSECLALEDYAGKDVTTMRIAQLKILQPNALGANPLVQNTVIDGAVTINLPACNLGDDEPSSTYGNFNLLLQFDLTAKKLKAGGAHPVADPLAGYTFADETIHSGAVTFHVQPIELDLNLTGNKFTVDTGVDLTIPIYQDKQATDVILLPLHQTRISSGTLSDDHNCIGNLDFDNLLPANNCKLPEPYIDGAQIDGFITLEEADAVQVKQANTTLCALLSGEIGMPSCSRDGSGNIAFKGDWCSTTDASGGCQDSVKLAAEFAAAAVKVNN